MSIILWIKRNVRIITENLITFLTKYRTVQVRLKPKGDFITLLLMKIFQINKKSIHNILLDNSYAIIHGYTKDIISIFIMNINTM